MTLLLNRRQTGALLLSATATRALHAAPASGRAHVPWARNTAIYEVNIRQFSGEGTLKAVQAQLPRIAKLGVGILWLMPLQPIGVQRRKGTLGSYYSIRDYTAVNPEFGTLADVRSLVRQAHALGMKVILDWVANHTAWDHPWITQHPDWYQRDASGQIGPFSHVFTPGQPPEVWDDVVGLDYGNHALWPEMTRAMTYWLREADLDGFRCDVASLVPVAYWEQARTELERIKPVFMLAEADQPELHRQAFDMSYDWKLFDTLKKIAKGQANAADVRAWWAARVDKYPADAIGMNFTGNHDSNSWDGSDTEFYGSLPVIQAMNALTTTLPGMPLIYGGQESVFDKRLQFFEKDAIAWKNHVLAPHLTQLLTLRRRQAALGHGSDGVQGGTLAFVDTGNDAVLVYTRRQGSSRLRVTVNLSAQAQRWKTRRGTTATLPPWSWNIQPERT